MRLRTVASNKYTDWSNIRIGSETCRFFTSRRPVVQQLRYRRTNSVELQLQFFENFAPLNAAQNALGRVSVESAYWSQRENCKAKTCSPEETADYASVGRHIDTGYFRLDGDCHDQQRNRILRQKRTSYFCRNRRRVE